MWWWRGSVLLLLQSQSCDWLVVINYDNGCRDNGYCGCHDYDCHDSIVYLHSPLLSLFQTILFIWLLLDLLDEVKCWSTLSVTIMCCSATLYIVLATLLTNIIVQHGHNVGNDYSFTHPIPSPPPSPSPSPPLGPTQRDKNLPHFFSISSNMFASFLRGGRDNHHSSCVRWLPNHWKTRK